MKRPILIALISYILGIILELYNIYIALFLIDILCICLVYKIIRREKTNNKKILKNTQVTQKLNIELNKKPNSKIRKIYRFLRMRVCKKWIIILFIFLNIGFIYTKIEENQYGIYKNNQEIEGIAIIIRDSEEKEYQNLTRVKYKNRVLYFSTNKNVKFKYGDKVEFKGIFVEPEESRNYKGFDYKKYLKSLKISGTIKVKNFNIIGAEKNKIVELSYFLKNQAISNIKKSINFKGGKNNFKNIKENENIASTINSDSINSNTINGDSIKGNGINGGSINDNTENFNIIIAMIFGDVEKISKSTQEAFKDSNVLHLLAVSGSQISLLTAIIFFLLSKARVNRRIINWICIPILICFLIMTGFEFSVVRACIMSIIFIFSFILNKVSDIWCAICFSLFGLLMYNPFLIFSLSVLLSYSGLIGILTFGDFFSKRINQKIEKIFDNIPSKADLSKADLKVGKFLHFIFFRGNISKEQNTKANKNIIKTIKKTILKSIKFLSNILILTISAQIFIFPIILYNFGTISLTFAFSNLIIIPLASLATSIGVILCFFPVKILGSLNNLIIECINFFTNIFSRMEISKIYLAIPNLSTIVLYYFVMIYIFYLLKNDYFKYFLLKLKRNFKCIRRFIKTMWAKQKKQRAKKKGDYLKGGILKGSVLNESILKENILKESALKDSILRARAFFIRNILIKFIIIILIFFIIFFNLENYYNVYNYKFNDYSKPQNIIKVFNGIQNLKINNLLLHDFIINFIDVGQGDSCLIRTNYNRKILIDGGGKDLESNQDIGENTLLPYLLNRKITKLDYIMISHFDSDHCNGLVYILENLSVDCVIISKQVENTTNFENIFKIIKNKNIKLKVVKAGDSIEIDPNCKIEILSPYDDSEGDDSKGNYDTHKTNIISGKNIAKTNEKANKKTSDINENSIVAKITNSQNGKSFSALFTGDIGGKTEAELLENAKVPKETKGEMEALKMNLSKIDVTPSEGFKSFASKIDISKSNILKSDILKVAHHGSKFSTTEEFIKAVSPKIALIGVGKKNTFGHPSEEVIERLKNNKIGIYRTDLNGEISIRINNLGEFYIKKHIN